MPKVGEAEVRDVCRLHCRTPDSVKVVKELTPRRAENVRAHDLLLSFGRSQGGAGGTVKRDPAWQASCVMTPILATRGCCASAENGAMRTVPPITPMNPRLSITDG